MKSEILAAVGRMLHLGRPRARAFEDRLATPAEMAPHFSGEKLYGEDLSEAERRQWYRDEQEGYAELVSTYGSAYQYGYHALNVEHGFRHVRARRFERVLGIGSAYGHEFEPILDRCGEITILDPSEGLTNPRFRYVRPDVSGVMPFASASFDLVTCLNVLHHVPNVSTYLREIARVLRPGASALISDPIVSMGDWRWHRPGATRRERGIPLQLFRSMLCQSELAVERERLLGFPLTLRLGLALRRDPYNAKWIVRLDGLVAGFPIWFRTYHATRSWQKLRPTHVYFVLCKPDAHSSARSRQGNEHD